MSMFDRLEDTLRRYEDVTAELGNPDIVTDQDKFRKYMKEQSNLAPIVEAYTEYKASKQNIEDSLQMISEESDEELLEMAREELADSKKKVEELEKKLKILLLPKDPNDDKDIVVEIRAGAGGEEAALFAAELFRMYSHYADTKGWKIEVVNADETGIGGMKEVEFMVKGQGAYSVMKYESGVHRVQRVPVTESNGRIQTSTASVAVMPEAEEVDIQIDDKDIRIDVMRASGNGGQCVNTTDSAVRLTHYPTGIVIYSQTEKSQIQNKEKAFALLRAKLYDLETQKAHDAEADARRSQMSKVESMMKEERYSSDADQKSLSDILEGLTKQQELAKSQMTKAFESGIGQMQGYQEQISNAKADVGNRITRLDLTKSRLTEQKTNFTSLKSENEDIDLEEVVISYTSAQLVYNAALSAASKVVQQTLLDFIG